MACYLRIGDHGRLREIYWSLARRSCGSRPVPGKVEGRQFDTVQGEVRSRAQQEHQIQFSRQQALTQMSGYVDTDFDLHLRIEPVQVRYKLCQPTLRNRL